MIPNINLANANSLVTSYKVDYDILSWSQYVAGWLNYVFGTTIPAAIGTSITIDSQYDLEVTLGLTATVTSWITGNVPLAVISGGTLVLDGVMCHLMDQVIYGMEQLIFPTPWW